MKIQLKMKMKMNKYMCMCMYDSCPHGRSLVFVALVPLRA